MSTRTNQCGKIKSVPGGLAIAVLISMIITLMLSMIIAAALNKEKLTWEQAGYWIMGMLLVASYIGGRCAYTVIKRQRIIVALMSGTVYWALLLCIAALFFGGQLGAVWETAGIIVAGSGLSALVFAPNTQRTGKKRYSTVVKLNKNDR